MPAEKVENYACTYKWSCRVTELSVLVQNISLTGVIDAK